MSKRSWSRRDASPIANEFVSLLTTPALPRSGLVLSEIEDRRFFSPTGHLAPKTIRTASVLVDRPVQKSPQKFANPSLTGRGVIAFKNPEGTLICVRRHRRKEVLHALGVAGKKVNRPKRNAFSNYSCKRK